MVSALTIKFLNKSIQDRCIQTIWQALSDPYFFAQPEEKIDGTGAAPLTRSPPSEVDIRFLALQVIENELRKLKSRLSYFESQREDRRRFMSNSEKKIIADRIDEYNNRILSKKSELKDAQNEYILAKSNEEQSGLNKTSFDADDPRVNFAFLREWCSEVFSSSTSAE